MDLKTIMISREDPNWPYYVADANYEKVAVKGHRHGLRLLNGHLLSNVCRNLSVVKSMDVREDDTFVVTYPKSGTNWVGEMCWLIKNNCDFKTAEGQNHMARANFVDMSWSNDLLNKMPSPRVFQSHLRLEFLPDNIQNRAKVVYVARNPKDVLVSLYFFIQKTPEDNFDGTMEELFDLYVNGGQVMYGAWWDHVNEYAKLNNIHIVHFEDLLEDSINETRKLAKFLGHELSDEKIKELVDFCSFDKLKSSPAFNFKPPPEALAGSSESQPKLSAEQIEKMKSAAEIKLFRKGQIGDWKNYFSEEMSKKIDEIVATKLDYPKPFRFEPNK